MSEEKFPHIVEGAVICARQLPVVPEISLYLMSDAIPQNAVSKSAYSRLMEQPPYWAFCWGGGQALARWILDNPESVRQREVIDFGAGSAVAGIAAAMRGARTVLAVDIDPDALLMARANAALNEVSLETADTFAAGGGQLVLAADVGYEEEGFACIVQHIEQGGRAIIAESRLRNLHQRFPRLQLATRYHLRTFPDLDEAPMFDEVHIYTAC